MTNPKVIVCQHGARHRYAIPRMLQEAGMLSALYTDSSVHSLFGKSSRIAGSLAIPNLKRLVQRRIDGVPNNKIYSSDMTFLSDLWTNTFDGRETSLDRYLRHHRVLSQRMIRWGLLDADAIISQSWENYDFLKYVKQKKKKIVVDVNGNPLVARIMVKESSKYPDWSYRIDRWNIERKELYFKQIADLADVLLCPSDWVADGVSTLIPQHHNKIQICPYGSSIEYNGTTNMPVVGRILFAGGHALLKGLQDIAQASVILKTRYPELDFRIVGITDNRIIRMPECSSLHFLGKLPWQQMHNEFLSADIFVFPTRSEGLAGVVLEAIAAGCPVITTKRAGINFAHSINGIVIEPGDTSALTMAIEKVYRDREIRNLLARNALHLANKYTMEAWKARLVNLLRQL